MLLLIHKAHKDLVLLLQLLYTNRMEEENKKYIAEKLKTVIEPMIAQVVLKKPADVPKFMLDWLKTTYHRSDDDEGSENESFSEEVQRC